MTPAARIWALVCGFPEQKRRKRLLGMFQVYLDESVGDPPQRIFAMCGFIGTAENWAAFSDEWQRHLDFRSAHYRKLEYFRLSEMHSERDKERIRWFYDVAAAHARCTVCLFIELPVLERVVDECPWRKRYGEAKHVQYAKEACKNPYFWAFVELFTWLPEQEAVAINSEIDFFFDETDSFNKFLCMQAWDTLKRQASPKMLALMGGSPAFRDDRKVLPLQAADLLAGTTRQWAEKALSSKSVEARLRKMKAGIADPDFPWPISSKLPLLYDFLTEPALRQMVNGFFDGIQPLMDTVSKSESGAY
jgi:hypothetical protein